MDRSRFSARMAAGKEQSLIREAADLGSSEERERQRKLAERAALNERMRLSSERGGAKEARLKTATNLASTLDADLSNHVEKLMSIVEHRTAPIAPRERIARTLQPKPTVVRETRMKATASDRSKLVRPPSTVSPLERAVRDKEAKVLQKQRRAASASGVRPGTASRPKSAVTLAPEAVQLLVEPEEEGARLRWGPGVGESRAVQDMFLARGIGAPLKTLLADRERQEEVQARREAFKACEFDPVSGNFVLGAAAAAAPGPDGKPRDGINTTVDIVARARHLHLAGGFFTGAHWLFLSRKARELRLDHSRLMMLTFNKHVGIPKFAELSESDGLCVYLREPPLELACLLCGRRVMEDPTTLAHARANLALDGPVGKGAKQACTHTFCRECLRAALLEQADGPTPNICECPFCHVRSYSMGDLGAKSVDALVMADADVTKSVAELEIHCCYGVAWRTEDMPRRPGSAGISAHGSWESRRATKGKYRNQLAKTTGTWIVTAGHPDDRPDEWELDEVGCREVLKRRDRGRKGGQSKHEKECWSQPGATWTMTQHFKLYMFSNAVFWSLVAVPPLWRLINWIISTNPEPWESNCKSGYQGTRWPFTSSAYPSPLPGLTGGGGLTAGCLLHEQPPVFGILYTVQELMLSMLIVHWGLDLYTVSHVASQISDRERPTMPFTAGLKIFRGWMPPFKLWWIVIIALSALLFFGIVQAEFRSIDECESSPCQNGGQCVDDMWWPFESSFLADRKYGYTCSCPAGWAGFDCELDVDECSSSPCFDGGVFGEAHAAKCTDSAVKSPPNISIDAFRCSCASGFSGGICASDYNVTDLPKYNSTCHIQEDGLCAIDIDECRSSPCFALGTDRCEDSGTNKTHPTVDPDAYKCVCNPGWTGPFCDGDLDECAVFKPCLHGATCGDSTSDRSIPMGNFTCNCTTGWANGICAPGYLPEAKELCTRRLGGTRRVLDIDRVSPRGTCDTDIDECMSSPCKNGATCADSNNASWMDASNVTHNVSLDAFACHCAPGWINGICQPGVFVQKTDVALCKKYEGAVCDVDVDECNSSPCKNAGKCSDSRTPQWRRSSKFQAPIIADRFSCECQPGWANGVCVSNSLPLYAKECSVIYGGVCDLDKDECSSAPCKNGATCTESVNTSSVPIDVFSCACTDGWANGSCTPGFPWQYAKLCETGEGRRCDVDIDECVSSPCNNSAACSDSSTDANLAIHSFACDCQPGWAGGLCATDFIAEYAWQCADRSTGPRPKVAAVANLTNCTNATNATNSSNVTLCGGNSTNATLGAANVTGNLTNSTNGTNVTVPRLPMGFGTCHVDINECASSPCWNGAECSDSTNRTTRVPLAAIDTFTCACTAGWSNGFCLPGYEKIDDYAHRCNVTGERLGNATDRGVCNEDIDECASSPCQNGGVCTHSTTNASVLIGEYYCTCARGWEGGNCQTDTKECAYQSSLGTPCKNGAVCSDSVTGWRGNDGRAWKPGGGRPSVGEFSCACTDGRANGVCAKGFIPQAITECQTWEGGNCDLDVDECASMPCLNNAACTDSRSNSSIPIAAYSCACKPGWAQGVCDPGHIEEVAKTCRVYVDGRCSQDIDECLSSPCKNGATCQDSTTLPGASVVDKVMPAVDAFRCICAPGWQSGVCLGPSSVSQRKDPLFSKLCNVMAGGRCDQDIDECASAPCVNNASCADSQAVKKAPWTDSTAVAVDKWSCQCMPGYANGICHKNFTAIPGYAASCKVAAGASCNVDINECNSNPCQNGGVCYESTTNTSVPAAEYMCRCPAGWQSHECESDTNECASNPCMNNATCSESRTGADTRVLRTTSTISIDAFRCNCTRGWHNGVCASTVNASSQGLWKCNVLEGGRCDLDIDECLSSPCKHGNCSDSTTEQTVDVGQFSCRCAKGWADGICHPDIHPTWVPLQKQHYDANCSVRQGGRCGLDMDECLSSPCLRGSSCSDGPARNSSVEASKFYCDCEWGWDGRNCSLPVDPCLRGADVYFTAEHNPGVPFTPDDCGKKDWSTCYYHGPLSRTDESAARIAKAGDYSCKCNVGYYGNGKFCRDIDECLSSPCKNGALCMDSNNQTGYNNENHVPYVAVQSYAVLNSVLNYSSTHGTKVWDLVNKRYRDPDPFWVAGDRSLYVTDHDPRFSRYINTSYNTLDTFLCVCPPGFWGHECQFRIRCYSGSVVENTNRNVANRCTGLYGDSCNFSCGHEFGINGTSVRNGTITCGADGTWSSASCVRTCYSSDHFLFHTAKDAGLEPTYRVTLNMSEWVNVSSTTYMYALTSLESKSSTKFGCDYPNYYPLTEGFEVVPPNDDFLDVVSSGNWSSALVDASNGYSAYTANFGAEFQFRSFACKTGENDTVPECRSAAHACVRANDGATVSMESYDECSQGEKRYGVESCSHRMLMRRPIPKFKTFLKPTCSVDPFNSCASQPCQNEATCRDLLHTEATKLITPKLCEDAAEVTIALSADTSRWYKLNCTQLKPYCKQPTAASIGRVPSYKTYDPTTFGTFARRHCPVSCNQCLSQSTLYTFAGFKCDCPAGFKGTFCEADVNECVSSPCKNGVCEESGHIRRDHHFQPGPNDDYLSVAPLAKLKQIAQAARNPGLVAEYEDRIDALLKLRVTNYTTRPFDNVLDANRTVWPRIKTVVEGYVSPNQYNCTCDAGWVGYNCDKNYDECSSSPCQHASTCTDKIATYSCACVPGWTGHDCEKDIDECASFPCTNGATCSDSLTPAKSIALTLRIDKYMCNCAKGWSGSTCAIDIDECVSSPCQNGGYCSESGISSRVVPDKLACECACGFSGVYCESVVAARKPLWKSNVSAFVHLHGTVPSTLEFRKGIGATASAPHCDVIVTKQKQSLTFNITTAGNHSFRVFEDATKRDTVASAVESALSTVTSVAAKASVVSWGNGSAGRRRRRLAALSRSPELVTLVVSVGAPGIVSAALGTTKFARALAKSLASSSTPVEDAAEVQAMTAETGFDFYVGLIAGRNATKVNALLRDDAAVGVGLRAAFSEAATGTPMSKTRSFIDRVQSVGCAAGTTPLTDTGWQSLRNERLTPNATNLTQDWDNRVCSGIPGGLQYACKDYDTFKCKIYASSGYCKIYDRVPGTETYYRAYMLKCPLSCQENMCGTKMCTTSDSKGWSTTKLLDDGTTKTLEADVFQCSALPWYDAAAANCSNDWPTQVAHGPFHSGKTVSGHWAAVPLHSRVKVSLRFWAIDSWNTAEHGALTVDSTRLWRGYRYGAPTVAEGRGWVAYAGTFPNPFKGDRSSDKWYQDVSVQQAHNGSALSINVSNTLSGGPYDESLYFNRLHIEYLATVGCV